MDELDADLGVARIRPFRPGDEAGLARHADDRRVWCNLRAGFPHPYTTEDARGWLRHLEGVRPATDFAIEVGGEVAGSIGIVRSGDRSGELGYWLGAEHWGRGIATAAVRAVAAHAFGRLGVDRLEARTFADNAASIRVLEQAGFVPDGLTRGDPTNDGREVATLRFRLDRPGPVSGGRAAGRVDTP